jgi:3-hydroxyisobutyrate dehydrogenase-like beta-hydroxyacid dehydrogenase
VGFIGLGNMGLPMTGNLVKKGYQVKAFDISPQSLEKCHEYGVKPVQSIAEVAQDVRLVMLIYIVTG